MLATHAVQISWYTQERDADLGFDDWNGFIDGYDLVNASIEWNGVMNSVVDLRIYGENRRTRSIGPAVPLSGLRDSSPTSWARRVPMAWKCATGSDNEPPLRRATSQCVCQIETHLCHAGAVDDALADVFRPDAVRGERA